MSEPKKSTIVEKTKDPLHIVYMVVGIITGIVSLFLIWTSLNKGSDEQASAKRDTTIVVINQAAPSPAPAPVPAPATVETKTVIVKEVVRPASTATGKKESEPVAPAPAPAPAPAQSNSDFNVARNGNRSGKTPSQQAVAPEVVQVYCSAYIVGTFEAKTGISVKARITEDLSTGNTYILKNTVLLGEITSVNNRLYIEFNGNKNVSIPLYAYDSNKNLGLLVQGKVSDGFKIYISNK